MPLARSSPVELRSQATNWAESGQFVGVLTVKADQQGKDSEWDGSDTQQRFVHQPMTAVDMESSTVGSSD